MNAIYLKAPWQYPFIDGSTERLPFVRADGSRVKVPTMYVDSGCGGVPLPYAKGSGWRAVELPYVGGSLAMTVVIPDNLAAFERRLTPALLAKVTGALEERGVGLYFPKLSIDTRVDVGDQIAALGMPRAFDVERADFTGIATLPEGFYISKIIHQANIDVDEKGTEAAAATAIGMATGGPGCGGPELTVKVDRPFLFLLRDVETGAILFMGRVVDPSAKE